MDLRPIYFETLARCAPDVLVASKVDPSMPRNVAAIGKCAGALVDGVARTIDVTSTFVAIPHGYPPPATRAEVHVGGHPQMTAESFAAGRALLEWVDAHDDILFLISGGGSACVEAPLPPFTEEEVRAANASLVASSLPIAEINAERRRRSAIKGGRLGDRVRGRKVTLVYSDVSTGRLADVASGPTIRRADEAILVADNRTLTSAAAGIAGANAVVLAEQLECDVVDAARQLAAAARALQPGQMLVAGGEPTVVLRGDGRGGRCSELALRFALETAGAPFSALFASSDGVDGASGAAGVFLPTLTPQFSSEAILAALARSDSASVIAQVGEPIMITPTGNNLRDLFLVARD